MDEKNRYIEELKKCKDKEVIVTSTDGKEYKGICVAINFMHLNVVIMDKTNKYIIKNIRSITRKRENDGMQ